ncbi:uncharacterized protein LOC105015009 [Esox lucius]|uniref:uncharacterized protein LOC105015009 n=1 Tax=Esox lucius TaxID=8010 RepID=UPI0005769F81|nr:uncharacterized protein LOC105015009 [Esox lucius]
MATSSPRFTWCDCRKHKILVKDTHELCLHCLGIQHAKEAVLEYGKCPHCAKMDWSTCINRLTKVQEIMHRESQQKKHEAAQSEVQLMPETTSATIKEPKPEENTIPTLPSPLLSTSTSAHSSTMPVLFTILSPPPAQIGVNSSTPNGTFISQLAIQQSADSTPSMSQPSSHMLNSSSRKRHYFSSCHASCSKHSKRSHSSHRRRRSPSSSSSSYWTSDDDFCPSGKGRRSQRESRQTVHSERRHRELVEVVQQRLEAQQKAVQLQWAVLEKRIDALERRGAEVVVSFPTPAQTINLQTSIPQTSTSQENDQRDMSGSVRDQLVTESISCTIVKQEEEPSSISSALRPLSDGDEEEEDASQSTEGPLSKQDLLAAKELQSLIARAAKYLGIDFPSTPTGPSPSDPTMVQEFEDLVQSSWANPASSKPYRELFSKMYRLHDCQSPAYNQMPQVNGFMSAIFQAVKPTENKEAPVPAERWRFTETLVERMYQTAGMLAKTANYLRYLSDYQRRLLLDISEDHPAQSFVAALNELKLIGQYTLQLSYHQAELSGRVMAASVAIRRQVWMAKTNYSDTLKATVADLPFVVSHTFGVSSASGPSSSGTVCKREQL